jgi:aspartyl-tRNA(Asn)/glutamyl-tRNA(Gln) amidotransferase subunit B
MEKAQMRCDVNISVRPEGQEALGEKIEIKNLNSFRAAHRALHYEIERQIEALENGETLRQETRGWNDDTGMTVVQRTKEDAHDYRYFPEPDLMPMHVTREWVDEIKAGLPETPRARRERFTREWGLSAYDAGVLTAAKTLADYFEEAAQTAGNAKAVANWIMGDLIRELGDAGLEIEQSPVSAEALAALVNLIDDGTISGKIAKTVFAEMIASGKAPAVIVKEKGLVQVTDTGAIDAFVRQAIEDNPGVVAEYRSGKGKALQYLVGQVMKGSRGKANPKMVVEALKAKLEE